LDAVAIRPGRWTVGRNRCAQSHSGQCDDNEVSKDDPVRAAVVNAVGAGFSIEDITIAEPIEREVLVSAKAAGLCQSDQTIASVDLGTPWPRCWVMRSPAS
jgi:hypothetical protein